MHRRFHGTLRTLRALPALAALGFAPALHGQGTPIGFLEEFALAADRAATLAKLIPGTEEHFYYSCLAAEHRRAFPEQQQLLATWIERFGRTERVMEIENRRAFLLWKQDPAGTSEHLRQRLGLDFQHRRETRGVDPQLPMTLDPKLIARETLSARALQSHPGTLDGFHDSALRSLAATKLDDSQLGSLLQRLRTPDVPNLPALIVRELKLPRAGSFGSRPIHRQLYQEQLDACAQALPSLLDDPQWIATYLLRLRPGRDSAWRRDPVAREAYLVQLEAFAQRLSPAQNSLKANILHYRLEHDLALGKPDEARFQSYLRLPRRGGWASPRLAERVTRAQELVDTSASFGTGFGAIENDEPLVRAYCERFFIDAASYDAYAELLDGDWVRRVFAETKILHGVGDMQRWYALLNDPGYYEQLRDRVEIRFAPTVKEHYGVDEPVSFDVELKNAGTLLVKVFEIHTLNFHREQQREIDGTIDLDGFVANEERTLTTEANPLRRTTQHLEFPGLNRRGTWVIELIGNGLSSRALIEKGRLAYVQRPSSAGQLVRVLDEEGQHLKDAALVIGGRELTPDPNGEILLPWSTAAGQKSIVLRHGEFSTLEQIGHASEGYALEVAIHVERESLLPGRKAPIVVRPRLLAGGAAIPVGLLEDARLTITALDHDGISTSLDVPGFKLDDARESVHEIQVPENLSSLEVTLSGRIASLTGGASVELSTRARRFALNGIDVTPATHTALLGRTAEGYVLDLLGKDGEPKADRAVTVLLRPREFRDEVHVTLRTNERGRISLGALDGIAALSTSEHAAQSLWWQLQDGGEALPTRLHGVEGETLRLPWPLRYGALSRANAGLSLEIEGYPQRDLFGSLAVNEGFLELRGLAAGDYALRLGDVDHSIDVQITRGPRSGGWAHGTERRLELLARPLLQVSGIESAGEELRIRLANASDDTRVHVVATRYLPPDGLFDDLRLWSRRTLDVSWLDHALSSYQSGRAIGDEYRYILDRRFATKYPGNMLRRAGLLLNPWALDEEETELGGEGASGGGRGGKRGGRAGGGPAPATARPGASSGAPGLFANLAFLPAPTPILTNLRPNAEGVVVIPRNALGAGQHVQVLALDTQTEIYTSLALPEQTLQPKPQQLARALDAQQQLAEQQKIEYLAGDSSALIPDRRVSKLATYGSLAEVHRLYRTLSGDEELARFAFLLRWNDLKPEEKLVRYAEHACHELHFFLYRKDRAFFDAVVKPYLANKAAKTFLDEWLLGADLSRYLESYAFARLNTVERILLAQRFPAERESIARALRETLELNPPDPERESFLFRGALQGDALSRDAGLLELAEGEEMEKKLAEGGVENLRAARELAPGGPVTPSGRAPSRSEAAAAPEPAQDAAPAEEMQDSKADKNADDRLSLGVELERRKAVRQLYRAPETTKRYVESNYWKRPIEEQVASLIAPNAFWLDYAQAAEASPFVSPHFAKASTCFAEMLLALAVLDLPLQAEKPEMAVDGIQLTVRAKTPILLVRQEIAQANLPIVSPATILVSQNFFRLDDRTRYEGNEQRDNYITQEFLSDVAYGAQIVVTNPTSSPRKLTLLLQIPAGALPVSRGFFTRGRNVALGPYATQSIEYAFYFPGVGDRAHYPVHVSLDGAFVAAASAFTFHVVAEPTAIDTGSWAHVSQNGTSAEVLAYLGTANLQRLDLAKIAWRCSERGFYDAVLQALRARKHFDGTLWSYAVLHRDEAGLREFLLRAEGLIASSGSALESELLTIDPTERRSYQIVEFEPLVNARAHRFGRERTILNEGVARQYLSLLDILAHRPALRDVERLEVVYHLLLQDRVEEALAHFAKVDAARLATKLQHDYLRAYLAFTTGDAATARSVATTHKEHPVERWRSLFGEVLKQLDEAEGKVAAAGESEDRVRQQTDLAEREPSLELAVEGPQLRVRYKNVARAQLSFFAMDVELLFSTRPFVDQATGSFAYVKPNQSRALELPAGQSEQLLELPAEFRAKNVWIELAGGGLVRRTPFYANSLAVRWIESYGQVQVSDAASKQPLPKVYVKVYAKEPGGKVRFHKDGYTDLRGRFDYASISGEGATNVERYAVLVLSDTQGAVIRELTPPAR
ncbi:MAG: hypothetical protein IPN34_12850 [Planctomycetes bacterium]|nr:hypothetical protein [Planctomycetota bacterium]